MKKIKTILIFVLCANIGFAQTRVRTQAPKTEYMTKAQVIELIKQLQPAVNVNEILKDTDGDGVPDALDREANTPKDCPVDTRGESLDSDADGVKDCDDKEPYTQPGFPTDPNGVATKTTGQIDCYYFDMCGYRRHEPTFTPFYFDKKAYILKGQTQADLKNIGHLLIKNNRICLAIQGYTDDNLKTEEEVAILCYQRAKAVADYLSANYGISADRLKIKIKGEENIIKGDRSEKNIERYNRRVEIYVTDCAEASDDAPLKNKK